MLALDKNLTKKRLTLCLGIFMTLSSGCSLGINSSDKDPELLREDESCSFSDAPIQKLNSSEYNETLRVLADPDENYTANLLGDSTEDRFDTVGSALIFTPEDIEAYYENARNASKTILDKYRDIADCDIRGTRSCQRKYLEKFLSFSFRRELGEEEFNRWKVFMNRHFDGRGTGFRMAVEAALISPHFLFKSPVLANSDADFSNSKKRTLKQFKKASRMSYFITRMPPDSELLAAAARGELSNSTKLRAQVERLFRSSKSKRQLDKFIDGWMDLHAAKNQDLSPLPGISNEIKDDVIKETQLLFRDLFTSKAPVTALVNAKHTFINEDLARLYQISDFESEGSRFKRYEFDNSESRSGILTHASLSMGLNPNNRTSPTIRGAFFMLNFLCKEVPGSPPDLEGAGEFSLPPEFDDLPFEEKLEVHRNKPECRSCHQVLDPVGYGLEQIDQYGRTRDKEIVPSTIPDGESFSTFSEYILALEQEKDIAMCMSKYLATFATGLKPEERSSCAENYFKDPKQINNNTSIQEIFMKMAEKL